LSLLLDTHVLVWWVTDDPRLSSRGRADIEDRDEECIISSVTAFELTTKARLGKLPAAAELADGFESLIEREGFSLLAITVDHGLRAGRLIGVHRDPFDRLLAAQSLIEGLPIITADPAFRAFGVETVW
jgi:PIN domain nuclease of toxin-antitoxin system